MNTFYGPTALPLKCSPTARSTFPECGRIYIFFNYDKMFNIMETKMELTKIHFITNGTFVNFLQVPISTPIFLETWDTKNMYLLVNCSVISHNNTMHFNLSLDLGDNLSHAWRLPQ